ncbi:ABC transporter ATP-binding protein [Gemella bergeri]
MNNKKIISVKNITKTIKSNDILKDISFDVYEGDCLALIGPNGAGKTTLMNCLLGNKFINSGNITINGLKPTNLELKRYVNVLRQENKIPNRLKVKELINFVQSIYPEHLNMEEIDKILCFDDNQKESLASKLSGGQRRLLSFVLTLIGKPKIIFLDEPTAGMDTSTRVRFWEIVNDLKKQGATIIYSSHYIEEVEHTADRILVLHKGELIRDTTPHAMRAEEVEKLFTLPVKYFDLLKNCENIYSLEVKLDSFSFLTKDADNIWKLLERNGCTFKDLEVQNRTLLDSIFTTTKEN